jgi:hypothetical protein
MNRPAVLDMEAFFWDPADFDQNSTKYFSLFACLPDFLQWLRTGTTNSGDQPDEKSVPESIQFVCSNQLMNQIWLEVCEGFIREHVKSYGVNLVTRYLTLVKGNLYPLSDSNELYVVTSTPEIIKTHFNAVVSEELDLISSEIHKKGEGVFTFFSYKNIWFEDNREIVIHDADQCRVRLEVVIADNEANFEEYVKRKERVFDSDDPKHDTIVGYVRPGGEQVSPLSCYRGRETSRCQELLNQAFPSGNRFYNYDHENEVWVVFTPSFGGDPDYCGNNLYHGFNETNEDAIPIEIRSIKGAQ